MKILLALIATVLLTSCGTSSSGNNNPNLPGANSIDTITFNGSNQESVYNKTTAHNLIISGSNQSVTISSNSRIANLTISASNSSITIFANTNIVDFSYSGSNGNIRYLKAQQLAPAY